MSEKKLTLSDLESMWNEIKRGCKDKTRTMNDINDSNVKPYFAKAGALALSTSVLGSALSSAIISGTATGALATGGIGIASGVAAGGVAASGLAGLGSAGASAFATAGAGAAAGSFIPVVGTLIGVGVGLTVGIFAGKHSKQKQQNKIIALQKEILQNQNTIINSLKKQLQELEEKYRETVKNNERYKYLLSLLMVNNELVSALEGV